MKVIKWVYPNVKYNRHLNYNYIDDDFDEYIEADYNDNYEDAIIKELIDNKYIICGDTHQNKCIPVFEDNRYTILSMRKWGEIMAIAKNLKENTDKYTYKDFYLVSLYNDIEYTPFDVKPSI